MEEHLIELKGLSPFLIGRLTLSESSPIADSQGLTTFNVEVDIIQSESGKIFNHIIILYNEPDKRDAINLGVHYLQKFLDSKVH
jgi:hypothetical protein